MLCNLQACTARVSRAGPGLPVSRAGPGLPVSRAGPGLPVSRASRLFNYFSSSPGWLTILLVVFD